MNRILNVCGQILAVTLLSLSFAAGAALAQRPAARAQATPAGNAVNGKKAFVAHTCYSCHGYSAEGGVGARLVGYPETLQVFAAYVRQPSGDMPPAGATISPADIADIYAYVRSIPASPDPKTIDLLKP